MHKAPTNLLLAMLPAHQQLLFTQLLEPIPIPAGHVFYEPDLAPAYVHFLTSGIASVVTYMVDGDAAEAGLVGREGTPEGMHLLGSGLSQTSCFMQVPGTGLRMHFRDFELLFHRDEAIRRILLRFLQYQNLVLCQLAACNRHHEIDQRLARWLLMIQERMQEQEIRVTQESLADLLGTRRSTVTTAAGTMQRAGLIEYRRGTLHILDRPRLEAVACECYPIARNALQQMLQSAPPSNLRAFPIGESTMPMMAT